MEDEEFEMGSGNWLRNRSRSSRCSSPPSSSTTYRWSVDHVTKPSLVLSNSSNSTVSPPPPPPPPYNMPLLQESHKQPPLQQTPPDHSNLQMMMGLGVSSHSHPHPHPHPTDWNQSLLRPSIEKISDENSLRTLLQQDHDLNSNTTSYQQADQEQQQWPRSQKMMMMYSSAADSSLNQSQLHHFDQSNSTNFQQLDPSSIQYQNNPSPTTMLPGVLGLGYEINQQQQQHEFHNRSSISNYNAYSSTYGSSEHDHQPLMLQWQLPNKPQINQLHLSNNAPFWNASAAAPIINHDVRSNFFPSLQMQSPSSTFDEKPKKSSTTTTSETSNKRPRNETTSTQSPLPAKAKKEKMGDRITALQQLVSPFGKTDTASVLSEAIEYIKFLHEQVSVLSNAYMKSGAPIQQQQKCEKSKDEEGQKQDLRSRGLCLVPVSSTFPVTHETTVDFWNPTFGGTFR